MNRSPPKLREVAERIVARETKRGAKASAAFIVFERLREPLAVLMGTGGFRSILSRALAVSDGDAIWLRSLHVKPNGALEGLEEMKTQISSIQYREASEILLESVLNILVAFVGEQLTFGILTDIWPQVSLENLGQEGKNEKEE